MAERRCVCVCACAFAFACVCVRARAGCKACGGWHHERAVGRRKGVGALWG